jgi:hypothetical protein
VPNYAQALLAANLDRYDSAHYLFDSDMNRIHAFLIPSFLALAACGSAPEPAQAATPRSITVFPVTLAGRSSPEVANVVGILLERGGAEGVELSEAAFSRGDGVAAADEASAFAAWVKQQSLATDLALRVVVEGDPRRGVDSIRTMLAQKDGTIVADEMHAKGSPAFDSANPKEPMDCCVFVVNSLRDRLGLQDPLRGNAKESKLAQRMQQKAGVPDAKEADAMMQRLADLRAAGKAARIRVYPSRVGDAWSAESAADLAARIEKSGLCAAVAESEPLRFQAKPSSNQQAVLWGAARSMQQLLREKGSTGDYALVCDFLPRGEGRFGGVHACLFAPDGSFVFVDLQNSHHDDFQSVDPQSVADCVELASMRVLGALRGD